LESLALHGGRPIILAAPCGHCLHERCFHAWSAERTAQNRRLITTCPCCNQTVEDTNICFSFESDPDENVENGDSPDNEPPVTRQGLNGERLWRHVVAGKYDVGSICLPLKLVVALYTVTDRVDYGKIIRIFIKYYISAYAAVFVLDHGRVQFFARLFVPLGNETWAGAEEWAGTAVKKKILAVSVVCIVYAYLLEPFIWMAYAGCSEINTSVEVRSSIRTFFGALLVTLEVVLFLSAMDTLCLVLLSNEIRPLLLQ
jgi:hypothetical protein